eukprot:3450545-Lingulodinium_polyedra.AAC.1
MANGEKQGSTLGLPLPPRGGWQKVACWPRGSNGRTCFSCLNMRRARAKPGAAKTTEQLAPPGQR